MLTKSEFVEALKSSAPDVFTTKAAAEKAYDAFCETLAKGISDGGARLANIGSFTVSERPARTGRNPQTGAPINIPARKVVKFSAAKALKDEIN